MGGGGEAGKQELGAELGSAGKWVVSSSGEIKLPR